CRCHHLPHTPSDADRAFVFDSLSVYSTRRSCFRAYLCAHWLLSRRPRMAADTAPPQPTTIQQLATAVYPSFAMLAGMQLDVFTPLKDGPLTATQLAAALGVQAAKLSPLLYALVAADLLTLDGDRFA